MEIGSIREQIVIAFLIYKFGYESIDLTPSAYADYDLKLFGKPVSIKTISKSLPKRIKSLSGSGVKLIWTVDWEKADEFYNNYKPKSELILVEVSWNRKGAFYYITLEIQKEVFNQLGGEKYIYRHRQGTNPRGVEISNVALSQLINHCQTRKIEIFWKRQDISGEDAIYKPYKRWVELWGD